MQTLRNNNVPATDIELVNKVLKYILDLFIIPSLNAILGLFHRTDPLQAGHSWQILENDCFIFVRCNKLKIIILFLIC